MNRQWLPLIRAAYHLNDSPAAWLRELAEAAIRIMDCGAGVIALSHTADDDSGFIPDEIEYASSDSNTRFEDFDTFLEGIPDAWKQRSSPRPPIHHTLSEQVLSTQSINKDTGPINVGNSLESMLADTGYIDALITHVPLDDEQGVILIAPASERLDPPLVNRARWASIAQHVRAGWELMTRLDEGINRAALHTSTSYTRPDTDVLFPILNDSDDDGKPVKKRPTTELWNELLDGETSIVDSYTEHLRARHYITLKNQPGLVKSRSLTERERSTINEFVRTASGADVAIELDITKSTVRQYLRSSMIKLGLEHRSELLQIAFATGFLRRKTTAAGLRPPTRPTHHAVRRHIDERLSILSVPIVPSSKVLKHLTDAEREVSRYVMLGWSTDQMARQRDTSERTIANQLASIFRKLDITDRYELTSRLLGAREDGSHIVH